jgi:hypothetical protein
MGDLVSRSVHSITTVDEVCIPLIVTRPDNLPFLTFFSNISTYLCRFHRLNVLQEVPQPLASCLFGFLRQSFELLFRAI